MLTQLAGTLVVDKQQILSIERGLMAKPRILMFDEPSLGLSPIFTLNLFEIIRKLKGEGITMLLAEQNVQLSLAVSDDAHVVDQGRPSHPGTAEQVRRMPEGRRTS